MDENLIKPGDSYKGMLDTESVGTFKTTSLCFGKLEQVGQMIRKGFPWHYIVQVKKNTEYDRFEASYFEETVQEYIEKELTTLFSQRTNMIKLWRRQRKYCMEHHWYLTSEIVLISEPEESILEGLNGIRGLNFEAKLDSDWKDIIRIEQNTIN